MPSSSSTSGPSTAYTRKTIAHVHTYKWPWIPFNIWMFLMLASSCVIIGAFSSFMQIQAQLLLPVPWYFPYFVTVASFSIIYVGTLVFLLSRHRLLPAIVMIGAFLVLVLWFVGLVVVSIQLWGPSGSVNGTCNLRVFNRSPKGDNVETLAWLMEKSIYMGDDDPHAGSASQVSTPHAAGESAPVADLPPDSHNDSNQSQSSPPPQAGHSLIETTFTDALPDESKLDQTDAFYDRDVDALFQDVESSFHAPISPLQTQTTSAVNDDTFLFDVPSRPQHANSPTLPPLVEQDLSPRSTTPANDRPTSKNVPKPTLLPPSDHDAEDTSESQEHTADVSNTTSELENFTSSPTAAAAARTISRAISSASARSQGTIQHDPNHDLSFGTTSGDDYDTDARSSTGDLPHAQGQQTLSVPSTSSILPRQRNSPSPSKPSFDAGNTPGHALRSGQRPKYLRSRNASGRSSTSSFTNTDHDDADSDVTVGQGAVPAIGMPPNLNNFLNRSISMGSMASGIDDVNDGLPRTLDALEPLDEDSGYHPNGQEDALKTPKPSRPLNAPTDTVIARHVRNVQVPESLAKEYKFKSGLVTPRKPSDFSVAVGTGTGTSTSKRSGKNLTLKEQSSTIERLSKENFDLKLKVMFLSDRLDKVSEEGVKEMISENVELKTNLAVIQRENKALRRRVKELEKQMLREDDERPSTAKSGASSEGPAFDEAAQEREEELYYLRERMEEYVVEVERLRHECINKEAEKRKLSEAVRSLGERTAGESLGRQDETDVWKDLLEQETARREQADDDNRRLREEIFRLKQDAMAAGGAAGLHHTTNIYNITKKHNLPGSPSRPMSGQSGEVEGSLNGLSTATTMIDELRRESDQLRHENAELRREVGAQTSMLTSRNREKERLYQEIEDLKMAQRRGNPAPSTIDTLLERSASRAGGHHQRTHSRASATTRQTSNPADEAEREELENQVTELRDRVNEVKLKNQELAQELERCMQDFETAVDGKTQTEEWAAALQADLEATMNDLVALQAERDEALREQAEMENEFEALRNEAQTEIDALEAEADQRNGEIHNLRLDLQDRAENFEALQEEMRGMSDALLRLEDEQDNKLRRIGQLEQEVAQSNKELEELEAKLNEANDKANRLGVQQESSQGEIAFLREEQEADKIRIGNLEAEVAGAEQALRDEKERAKELDQRLQGERRQREMVANREKEEVQQFVNDLNREASAAKDEARKLRKALSSREVEAAEWKERLMELEGNLRVALGDLNGTRSSLLNSISNLQRQLEDTVRELNATKADIVEKDRLIKQRDTLMESHSLESRRLAELLDKERQAHRATKSQFETFQKTHHHVSLTVSTQESRIQELESSRSQAAKKLVTLEGSLKEQLTERNNLLLVLWVRLSTLCGSDWAHDNSLISGRALPSLEAVATMLPGFSKNLLGAVKTVEAMVGGFQTRIKAVERELWREYQNLENGLEMRTKTLDRLESIVRNGVASGTLLGGRPGGGGADVRGYEALEEAYRQLKVENATLRTASDVRARAAYDGSGTGSVMGSPSPSIPTGPRDRWGRPGTARPGTSASMSTITRTSSSAGGKDRDGGDGAGGAERDNPLMLRLREMERKLRAEREGRNQDRSAARARLGELEGENRELAMRIRRSEG
ncbi:related to apsB protein [Cephalotrichum gorgonifer]|uniref:Related to apsB protein n=1 Tax=Cephalotrichum gorgonifer TaxID=2041049 RepID=A0AAE8MS43_9PEZI|nr:related to apsB protein [Cephalotrichum gorgonifer]